MAEMSPMTPAPVDPGAAVRINIVSMAAFKV
jgi:hypothetical protein